MIECDVLICGGGCAGLTAAVASARAGAKTMLVERAGFAGGIITNVGLPFFDGLVHKSDLRIVVRGIPLEIYSALNNSDPKATHLETTHPHINNIEAFKTLADRMLTDSGVRVWFHAVACDVKMVGSRIDSVGVASKGGLEWIRPKVVVDCSGDADLAAWSGAPTEKKKELQPMTLHFRLGNVRQNPELGQKTKEAAQRAYDNGDLPMFYGPGMSFFFADDEAYVHAVRIPGDATDVDDLTRAEMAGRRDAWTMFEYWKRHVPGFEDSYFISSGPDIGVRETRRIVGEYVLSEDDITATKKFGDAVATGCWYLDQHPNTATLGTANLGPHVQPDPYDIPYRSLLPKNVSNLIVAGRCHSSTQLAASSTRVTVTAMALGEAAGIAAALSATMNENPLELSVDRLQQALRESGAGPEATDA